MTNLTINSTGIATQGINAIQQYFIKQLGGSAITSLPYSTQLIALFIIVVGVILFIGAKSLTTLIKLVAVVLVIAGVLILFPQILPMILGGH